MILIIDDDATTAHLIQRLLTLTFPSVPVGVALTALAGMTRIQEHAGDLRLVILDVHMPGTDGRAVARHLRTILPDVPVLPLTGDVGAAADLAYLGCEEPLFKPVGAKQIIARVQPYLELPELHIEVGETPHTTVVVPCSAPLPSGSQVLAFRRGGPRALAVGGNALL